MIRVITVFMYATAICFIANSFNLILEQPNYLFAIIPIFLFTIIFAGSTTLPTQNLRWIICHHGTVLLITFVFSLTVSFITQLVLLLLEIPEFDYMYLWGLLYCIIVNAIVFWIGILCVYLTSTQLGIKIRVFGAICGMFFPLNLFALFYIIKTTETECNFESEKEKLNLKRKNQRICATKYPILLVHGMFLRDYKYFDYWGRIPKELINNGAQIFYGHQQSATAISISAEEIAETIKKVIAKTGAEKVNIIAHSKGGLDCRYAISELGVDKYVASLTTVSTPHRGCIYANKLLKSTPKFIRKIVARSYNSTLKKLGDHNPDFLTAVNDLTDESCKALNEKLTMPENIYCQSVGSIMRHSFSGRLPMNLAFFIVERHDGPNDGLVGESSFAFGEKYTLLAPKGIRGISHSDMMDFNRRNLKDFDVREFYVQLVNDLKNRGY